MLDVLAQTYTTYTTTQDAEAATGFLALFFGSFILFSVIILAIYVVSVIALWKIFEKAGVDGWKAIIPIYNFWTLCEIVGKPGWWALVPLLMVIPFVNIIAWIAVLVISVIVCLELGKAFGKDVVWSIFLLVIFSIVGILILGFGQDKFDKSLLSSNTTSSGGGSTPPATKA